MLAAHVHHVLWAVELPTELGQGNLWLLRGVLERDGIAALGQLAVSRGAFCRTFSDCTTAPRNGMISGCFPLDTHYKKSPHMIQLTQVKKAAKLA